MTTSRNVCIGGRRTTGSRQGLKNDKGPRQACQEPLSGCTEGALRTVVYTQAKQISAQDEGKIQSNQHPEKKPGNFFLNHVR